MHVNFLKRVDQQVKDKIVHPSTKVIGAGSVFGYGINGIMAGKNPFTVEELKTVVEALAGKTDADLGGGDYAFCEGSNAIFVLGYMQTLNINEIQIINVNNADGALLYEPFWTK
jgi:hypothetical protein